MPRDHNGPPRIVVGIRIWEGLENKVVEQVQLKDTSSIGGDPQAITREGLY
jgi:hypothetical protein